MLEQLCPPPFTPHEPLGTFQARRASDVTLFFPRACVRSFIRKGLPKFRRFAPRPFFSSRVHHAAFATLYQIGWSRCGDDVVYFQNQYCAVPVLPKRPPPTKKGLASSREASTASLYTLSFLISFPHTGDTAYISQCYPFTYSMQQRGSRHLCTLSPGISAIPI